MAECTPLVEAWIRYAEDDWQDCQILFGAGGWDLELHRRRDYLSRPFDSLEITP